MSHSFVHRSSVLGNPYSTLEETLISAPPASRSGGFAARRVAVPWVLPIQNTGACNFRTLYLDVCNCLSEYLKLSHMLCAPTRNPVLVNLVSVLVADLEKHRKLFRVHVPLAHPPYVLGPSGPCRTEWSHPLQRSSALGSKVGRRPLCGC
jgi:hypothetical protein